MIWGESSRADDFWDKNWLWDIAAGAAVSYCAQECIYIYMYIKTFPKYSNVDQSITHRNVAWSVEWTGAAEIFCAYGTADDVNHGQEIVAERQEDYRSLGIAKSGRLDPEGQQSEQGR